jgi:peptide/nickel transport system ATP-binding protein
MALMFISHDLGVVAQACSRVITMYAGQMVEDGSVDEVLTQPLHPYTSGLLCSIPRLGRPKTVLPSIPGRVPRLFDQMGCRFETRCTFRQSDCDGSQPMRARISRRARCCRLDELTLPGAVR